MEVAYADLPVVAVGYVRLSRDDNKRNYTSIINQKKIIQEYAEQNNVLIREFYEDDGISGYSFERPEFQRMMENLDKIPMIIAKDLSRIGRHNAKVLLFLEEMEELGKRIVLIDDNYDSWHSEDDIIGIKTWDNERHVKTTSRKVKRVKKMEQQNGTLVTLVPFGYIRHPLNRQLILIDEEAAAILHTEKEIYLDGNGILKTADILNERLVPTPSMLRKARCEALGLPFRQPFLTKWNYGMVRDTLFNDFHNGVLRLHKRERLTINGKDHKVAPEQQCVFPDHHPKIFDDATMELLLRTKAARLRGKYRGQPKHKSLFSGCLTCKDCGSKLTGINRPERGYRYYICCAYNKKGKSYCQYAHLIREPVLLEALTQYLTLCRDSLRQVIRDFDFSKYREPSYTPEDGEARLRKELQSLKDELIILAEQKIKEITANPAMAEMISATYAPLQTEKMGRFAEIEKSLAKAAPAKEPGAESQEKGLETASEILNDLLERQAFTRKDIEILIEKMVVDKDGNVDIYLNHGLGRLASREFQNKEENLKLKILLEAITLLEKDTTGYTNVKYLADSLKVMGYPMYKKKFNAYMDRLLLLGLVERSEIYHKPYRIIASKEKMADVKKMLIALGQTGGMPEMVLEYTMKQNGLIPQQDVEVLTNIQFALMGGAFTGGTGDYVNLFEPVASQLEQEGQGYIVASLGKESGAIPYTVFSATKEYMAKNEELIQKFTTALAKAQAWVLSAPAEEVAAAIKSSFPDTDDSLLISSINRYRDQGSWAATPVFTEEAFELLQDIMTEAGQLEKRAPYEDLVTNQFAEAAVEATGGK